MLKPPRRIAMSRVAAGLPSVDVGMVEIPLLATLIAQVTSVREPALLTDCENAGCARLDAACTDSASVMMPRVFIVTPPFASIPGKSRNPRGEGVHVPLEERARAVYNEPSVVE